MSRTRNSAWNFAAGIGFALASAAASLIATPQLLRWIGAERLGAYKALTDWVGYLMFFEAGLGGALMGSFAVSLGKGDGVAVTRMLSAGLRAYWRVMLAQLVCGIALVIVLPHLVSTNSLSVHELRIAGAIALFPIAFTPLLVFRALAEARQRGYLNWLLMTAQVLVMNGLLLFAARLGRGLIGLSIAFAVAQIPTLLVLAWDGTKAYHGAWKTVSKQTDRTALWRLSWPTFIHGLTDRVGLLSDNIVIAWMLGPAAVVPFFLTQQLAILAQSQLKGLGNATWAGLAELSALGDKAKLQARLLELTGLVSGLGMVVLLPIAAYNRAFVHLWVSQSVYAGDAVTELACLNAWLWAIFSLWGWIILGAGLIRQWMPFAIFSTLINIVVSVIGTTTLGLIGPLLGTLTALLLVTSWALPLTLYRIWRILPRALWWAALRPLYWSLPYGLLLWLVARFFPPANWIGFLTATSAAMAVGLTLWWSLSLRRDERSEWQARLRNMIP